MPAFPNFIAHPFETIRARPRRATLAGAALAFPQRIPAPQSPCREIAPDSAFASALRSPSTIGAFAPCAMSALALLWLLLAAPGAFAQHGGGGGGHSSGGGGGHASSGGGASHGAASGAGASASGARASSGENHLGASSGGGGSAESTRPVIASGSAATFRGISRWQDPPSRPISAGGGAGVASNAAMAGGAAPRNSAPLSVTTQNRAPLHSTAYFIRPASSPAARIIRRPRPPIGLAGSRPLAESNGCVTRFNIGCGPYSGGNYGYGGYGFGLFGGYGLGFPYCFDGISCDSYGGYDGDGLGYYSGGYYGGAPGYYGAAGPADTVDETADTAVDMDGNYIYVNPRDDSEEPASPSGNADTANSASAYSGAANAASVNAAPITVLYLKDGSSYGLRDYWLQDGRLRYVTTYGGANGIDIDRIDMQRTVDENAKNGVTFTLRPGTAPRP
jgi:hypothetical protein